jgi:hypothetical protein
MVDGVAITTVLLLLSSNKYFQCAMRSVCGALNGECY